MADLRSGVASVASRRPIADTRSRAADYLELTKPGITLMVILSALAGFLVAARPGPGPIVLFWTLLGTGLSAAGAGALNMFLERETDALMLRTRNRPLPAGRVSPLEAAVLGVLLATAGLACLYGGASALTATLSAVTLGLYLFVYTPLKRRAWWCLIVGAVPGALPILMGWTAAWGEVGWGGWLLFGLLFLWQFPHFLALAWLYREDYARANLPMISVIDADGSRSARQTIFSTLALVAVSLFALREAGGGTWGLAAVGSAGLFFLWRGLGFGLHRTLANARRLFLASVAYLPVTLSLVAVSALLR
ncbi:MAG: protoheme IX farnesyltransferase [Nitrospirae bacterium]|nr:protoheme IX farnesyltransferase [Nitrospirota bacterium]